MNRSWVRVALLTVFCVLGGVFLLHRWNRTAPARAAEDARAAIEELHHRDVSATLARDPKALADLFTEDAVLLEPGEAPVIGKQAILAENERDHAAHPAARVVAYRPDVKDLQIREGWAFEWDTFAASYQESAKSEVKTFHAKALRVLKQQPDGSWRFARVAWNMPEGQ